MSSTSSPQLSPSPPTRTLAIIKSHALKHRMTIEHRVIEAGFEIIKERQMQFNPEADREILLELFGDDADSLGEDAVWVYVLERRRAVEVFLALMGDPDPALARISSPNSLRAIYGIDTAQNAFIGSPDNSMAEQQIAVIFASSPPFPSNDLPPEEDVFTTSPGNGHGHAAQTGSVRSLSSSVLSAAQDYARSNGGSSTEAANGRGGHARTSTSPGKVPFRARPVPATNAAPSIQPRMTRAASLRQGIAVPDQKQRRATTGGTNFVDVPGHKRSQPIAVASTAAPTIAPRQTRASALRSGELKAAAVPSLGKPSNARMSLPANLSASTNGNGTKHFIDVPGHRRSEVIQVASTAPPAIAPRSTRASALRAGGPTAASPKRPSARPSTSGGSAGSGGGGGGSFSDVPGHKRTEVIAVASTAPPLIAPRPTRASALRTGEPIEPPPVVKQRPASVQGGGAGSTFVGVPGHKRSETIEVASVKAPAFAPRVNKSATLRARGDKAPPTSFMFRGPTEVRSPSRQSSETSLDSRPTLTRSVSAASMRSTPVVTPASIAAPEIAPRTNRSALLRALKIGK